MECRTDTVLLRVIDFPCSGYPIANDKLYNCPEVWPKGGKGAEFGMTYEEVR